MQQSMLVAVGLLVAIPAWGSGEWQASPKPAPTSLYEASLIPTIDELPLPPASVRNVDTDRPHTQGILASTTWLKGAFSTEAEVSANQAGTAGLRNSPAAKAGDDSSTRMMQLGLTGTTGLVRYGMTYRQAGQAFYAGSDHHTLEAALGYTGAAWDTRLASSFGLASDLQRQGAESHVQSQTVTASFRPASTLTIAPTLGYRAEQQEWSGARIDSPSASLAMTYQQSPQLGISVTGNYSGTRSSDRLIDVDNVGGKGILTWGLEPVRDWTPQLSLEAGYNLQVNRLMPSAQTENISGLLRLVLATL